MVVKESDKKVEFKEVEETEEFPDDFFVYDKENVIDFYNKICNKVKEAYKIAELVQINFENKSKIDEIVLAGMGGSAISGMIMQDYVNNLGLNLKIVVANEYKLPKNISDNALVICTSYSGNTEETLSMFKDAQRRKLRVMSVCSGGKLEDITNNYRLPLVKVPTGLHPRQAFPYLFFPLIKIFEKLNILEDHSGKIEALLSVLRKQDFHKLALNLVEKLYGKRINIYSSKLLKGVIYRWKTQFNENSKVAAHIHFFPELCHNELCQYSVSQDEMQVILLKNDKDSRRMRKRMDITKKLISKNAEVTEIDISGSNVLNKIFTTVLIGDLASYYLAIRYRRDPSDDAIIGELKKNLGPFIN
jgi:glucose/mannose-6-phosphate isomerase